MSYLLHSSFLYRECTPFVQYQHGKGNQWPRWLNTREKSPSPITSPSVWWQHSASARNIRANAVTTRRNGTVGESSATTSSPLSKCVLVIGVTGGVGQLVLAGLVDRGIRTRALLRDQKKAFSIFGKENMDKIEVFIGDTRNMDQVDSSVFEGITHVICCTGTTAFPSRRWDGENTPENTDWHGVRNVIAALPKSIHKFILVSSIGVTKYNQLPWNIMNLFGVLTYKKMAEDYLRISGISFTIIRAGRLTDGPYTSYDLNTLLKATAGTRHSVVIGQGDKLVGEASRVIVAEACIQALDLECTCGQTYEINSVKGAGPGKDRRRWEVLFKMVHENSKS